MQLPTSKIIIKLVAETNQQEKFEWGSVLKCRKELSIGKEHEKKNRFHENTEYRKVKTKGNHSWSERGFNSKVEYQLMDFRSKWSHEKYKKHWIKLKRTQQTKMVLKLYETVWEMKDIRST